MSEVLDRVREKYPEYKDIPEDELALRIGTKYPAYLDHDEKFKSEFQGVVTDRALKSSQAGTLDLIRVLGNPAAGEAAQEGRDQDTFSKEIGQQEQPPRSGEERAAAEAASLRGSPFDPLKERERGLRPQTVGERVESTLRGLPLVGKAFTPTQLPYEVESERSGIKEKTNVANAVRDLLGGVIKPESMALLLSGAGEAQIAKLSPALAQSVQKVVSGYFAWQGAKGVAEALPEAFKPGKSFSERLGYLTAAAGSGAIAGLAGAGLLKEAAKTAEPVAPMTAAAVKEQPAILETAKPEERPTMTQEPLEGIQTPPAAESPAVPPAALEGAPSEQITAASYTHPETGETTTGQNHIEAAKAQGVEAPKVPTERHGEEYGYEVQDPKTGATRYVSRDEAEAIARKSGQLLTEPTLGKLHSNEIWHAIPFEKRERLKQVGLNDQDIADLESGKNNVEEIVARNLPAEDRGPDHAAALEDARIQSQGDIETILQERKPNAIHRETAAPVRDVQQPGGAQEGTSEVPADETGKEVSQGSGEVPQKAPELSSAETISGDVRRVSYSREGKPIGYGQLDGRVINYIEVDEKSRGKGIGTKIVNDLRDRGGQIGVSTNPESRRIMEKAGAIEYAKNHWAFPGSEEYKDAIKKVDVSEGETEPNIEPPGAVTLPTRPELPEVKEGQTKAQKQRSFKDYLTYVDRYEEDLKAWEEAQPKNKGILFKKENGQFVAITRDPQGDWRATTFFKPYKDDPRYAPWGHERYTSRYQAVKEHVAEVADKLPEIMTEDELKAKQQEPPKEQAAISTEQLPKVAEAAKEPRSVAQALSSTKRFNRETELGGPDILSWMHENMKMLSKTAARLKWGREKFRENESLWDDSVEMQRVHHNVVFSPRGDTPDKIAKAAFAEGKISDSTEKALFAEMDAASKKRANVFATERREEKFMAEEAKQHTDWLKATKEGERRISADQLKVGDMLEVDDQQVEVTDVDADGNVTLKDGRKFGTQTLGEGQSIHVEKWDPSPESEADFAPTEVAPEAQPIEEPKPAQSTPKLGAMEKGTGDLLKGVEEEFALVGDKGTDAERVAAEKSKAEKTAQEARAIELQQQGDLLEKREAPEGATPEPAGAPPEAVQQRGKVRLKGTGPQTYSVVEHLPATEIEISNGEQPVRVKNDKTGAESVVLESQLQEVQERTAEQREASKGMSRKELDDELRRVGLDPSSFGNSKEKRAALKRAKAKGYTGPGAMGAQDPFDPAQKAQIEQLTEAMKGLQGRKVSLMEKIKESFNIVDRVSAAKDAVSRAITALKNSGDYVINQWKGKQLDEMLREKGVLSGELEKRGWRAKQFAKQVLEDIPDKAERAAIGKWIDAGGSQQELLWGANHTKPEYRQAYIDAIHLSGDKLVAARQIQSYFDARLQEAIDAGVLQDGIDDYIHRIFEKDPEAAQRMNGYVQSGILSRNPALAKKRIFQMDWEAERLGYKVVQDFVPRIVDYESSLARAIAARAFIRKMIGFTDENGVKQKGMLAPDGRPVIDVAGTGSPVEDQAGVREATLINPSFKPSETKNPLNERGDYKERPEYSALKKWKWASEDAAGKPIYVQGNVLVHPDFEGRIDSLLKSSSVRYAKNPVARGLLRGALTTSSTVKQTMLDFSGFHQVQEIVHGLEHGVLPWKIIKDIDFMDPNVDALMKGGVTLGGEYRMAQAEGLVGRSLSNLIPGVSTLMKTYHGYLFQDFIPRLKMSMAIHAFERNKVRFANEISSGQMTLDDVAFRTASEANAAFGGLNYTMLERSKTGQDIARLILLAPDFLEARTKFVAQALKRGAGDMKTAAYWRKGGPLTSNEQRQALLLGAITMYSVARIANQLISGRPHFEPENAFSVVVNGKAYGLRTVQGDVLHMIDNFTQFWMSRLNPVFGRTLMELGTGRDYFGRKRSKVEQLWDAVATVAPVSLRFGRERSIWESLANGMGITARRYNDADQAFKLAQKWKDKNGIQSKGEFVYDSDKDPLRPLKLALVNGDEAGAVKELKKLKSGKSKYNTDFALNMYFNHYATMRFTGSEENDRKFIASLSADEKKTVEAAKQAKLGMRELYFKANAKTVPQKVDVDRSGVDVPIPQLPQRIE